MITSLSLHRFKSWRKLESMRLAPITGLFGANSSGKSSIIHWLLLLKQTAAAADRQQVLNLGDEKSPVRLGTFADIAFAHKSAEGIGCSLRWSLPKEISVSDPDKRNVELFKDRSIGFECELAARHAQPLVRSMQYNFAERTFLYEFKQKENGEPPSAPTYMLDCPGPKGYKFVRQRGRKWNLPAPIKCYGFPDQVFGYYKNTGFLADFQLAFEQLFDRLYYLGPLREYPRREYTWGGGQPSDVGQRGEKVVDALLGSRSRPKIGRGKGTPKFSVEEYTAYWLKQWGLIDDFEVEPVDDRKTLFRVTVRKTPASSPVLITDVGFGVSQILPVIVLCYYVPTGSTIILEQPEIHLHPSVQSGLADLFIDAVRVRGIQILVESHSEHLLRRLRRRIAEGALEPQDLALYFCRHDGKESTLDPLELDLSGNIRNWPKDFFGDEFGEMAAITRAAMQRQDGNAA